MRQLLSPEVLALALLVLEEATLTEAGARAIRLRELVASVQLWLWLGRAKRGSH